MALPPWLPVCAARLTSLAVYNATQPFWITPGIPIIVGKSPQEISAMTGAPIIRNPTYAQSIAVPNVPVFDQIINSSGMLAPIDVGSGTVLGLSWAWQCSVELYLGGVLPGVVTGRWDQQVLTYTGDGSANRPIATSFPLNVGTVAIWICGDTSGNDDYNCFRHNGAAMLGTHVCGASTLFTTTGIMLFTSSGFTVSKGAIVGTPFANGAGLKYTAIVLRDTTSDNRFLKVNSYTGDGLSGRLISPSGTHIWIWNGNVIYRSAAEFSGDVSLPCAFTVVPIAGAIQNMSATTFTVGTSNDVNALGRLYHYVALNHVGALQAANLFQSFKGVGTGSTITVPLNFTPGVAFAGWIVANPTPSGAVWRGPQLGTHSDYCANVPSDITVNGISAMGSASIDVGTVIAPNARTFYGWAWKGGINSAGGPPSGGPVCPPNGFLGMPYFAQLIGSGGVGPPYTFVLVAGSLPPGLTLNPANGIINGVPTTVGTYVWEIDARDSTLATTAQFVCTMVISGTDISPTPPAVPPATGGSGSGCIDTLG